MKKYKQRTGFAKIPHALIDTWGQILGPQVTMVYICIISHASYKTQSGFPSYATIAAKCGMHRSTVIDVVADLVFLEFVGKKACWHKDGDQDTNNYYVLDMPDINDAIAKFVSDVSIEIPKKREWIVKSLKAFFTTIEKKRENENMLKARNTPLDKGGVVVTDDQGGRERRPPVVVTDDQGGRYRRPKREILKEIHVKDTHLHTGDSENEKNKASDSRPDGGGEYGSGGGEEYFLKIETLRETKKEELPIEAANELIWEKLFSEEERQFVSAELAKLNDPKMSQAVLDEVAFKQDRIKLSLPVYTKGLVTKANAGSFTPTANLAKKRAENAQATTITKINRVVRVKPKASRLEPLLQNELMRELQTLSDKDDWFKYVCGTQFLRVDGKIIVLLNHEITLKHYKNKPKLVETIQAVTGLTPVIRVDFRENWEITN